MGLLLLFIAVSCSSAASLATLSTSPRSVQHENDELPKGAVMSEASELTSEQKIAEDLTASLQNTVDSSKKLQEQVRSLKARAVKAEKLISKKDQEIKQLKKKEAVAEKSLRVKSKMLLHDRHENDLLKKKVKDLEQDIEVTNHAWKEAAYHEKEIADEEKENAEEEAAKNDRLSQQMTAKPQKKRSEAVPKAKSPHTKYMKSLKKQTVKLAKKAGPQADVEVGGTLDPMPANQEDSESWESADSEIAAEDLAPGADPASDTAPEDQIEVPPSEQPAAEVKQAKNAGGKPPTVQVTGGAADVQSDGADDEPAPSDTENSEPVEDLSGVAADAQKDLSGDASDAQAEKEDDSDWTLTYSPAGRAAAVSDSVEGDTVETEDENDVLSASPDAPMPVEEDPNDPVKPAPDMMGRV